MLLCNKVASGQERSHYSTKKSFYRKNKNATRDRLTFWLWIQPRASAVQPCVKAIQCLIVNKTRRCAIYDSQTVSLYKEHQTEQALP